MGCIFAELIAQEPLFPAKNEVDLLDRTFTLLGVPNDRVWPGMRAVWPAFSPPKAEAIGVSSQPFNNLRQRFPKLSPSGLDLLKQLLAYDPSRRLTAAAALEHPYFTEEPLPQSVGAMPPLIQARAR